MKKVTCIIHSHFDTPGTFKTFFLERGFDFHTVVAQKATATDFELASKAPIAGWLTIWKTTQRHVLSIFGKLFKGARRMKILVVLLFFIQFGCASTTLKSEPLVPLADVDPSIVQEMRYSTSHNFIGRPIKGYNAPKCFLTKKAAQALSQVQTELKTYSLSLKVYDCYRPQRAVDDFVAWAKDLSDLKMKNEFYPKVDKSKLFDDGYIAAKSGHSRGSTVDLTIIPLPVPEQSTYKEGQRLKECYLPATKRFKDNSLDMGTGYDCFDPLAHTAHPEIGKIQKQNRLLLKSIMEKFGFENYENEWWHFTLKNEPYPSQYFDYEIN